MFRVTLGVIGNQRLDTTIVLLYNLILIIGELNLINDLIAYEKRHAYCDIRYFYSIIKIELSIIIVLK